jgi:prepilin-type N-terminal cleavage/methylation domain-containing protein
MRNRTVYGQARHLRGGRAGNIAKNQAFTLIEAMVATVILGMGVAAVVVSLGSGSRINQAGRDMTQATLLAQNIREWTLQLPFTDPDEETPPPPGPDGSSPQVFVDDLDDLMNVTYSPPRDGSGEALSDMGDWSQTITMSWRDPVDINTAVADGASDLLYLEVTISKHGQEVVKTGWLVGKRE